MSKLSLSSVTNVLIGDAKAPWGFIKEKVFSENPCLSGHYVFEAMKANKHGALVFVDPDRQTCLNERLRPCLPCFCLWRIPDYLLAQTHTICKTAYSKSAATCVIPTPRLAKAFGRMGKTLRLSSYKFSLSCCTSYDPSKPAMLFP